jgi:hypothetical protein
MRVTDYSDRAGWQEGCIAAALDFLAGKESDPLAWVLDGCLAPEEQDYFILGYRAKYDSMGFSW